MTLNVDAIRNFSTVLHAIPFDTLTIQDFYQSLRSFYIGMLNRLVKKYGKNNPYIINVTHAFENFLQVCDFIKPLPSSLAQFTGMMASIIWDVYRIDLDLEDLRGAAREMKLGADVSEDEPEPGPSNSGRGPSLTKEEMKEVLHVAHIKTVSKKAVEEDAHFGVRVDRILSKMKDVEGVRESSSPDLRAALATVMKQDEREVHASKLKFKKGKGSSSCK